MIPSSTRSRDSRTWASVSLALRARYAGVDFSGVMLLPPVLGECSLRLSLQANRSDVSMDLIAIHSREVLRPWPSHPSKEPANRTDPEAKREDVCQDDQAPLLVAGGFRVPGNAPRRSGGKLTPTATPTPG